MPRMIRFPTLVCLAIVSPICWITVSTFCFRSCFPTQSGSFIMAAKRTDSCTVKYPIRASFCWMYAVSCIRIFFRAFRPSTRMEPS